MSAQLGVNFTRYNDFRGKHRILEANGGGCGIVDFDKDSWPDLLFMNGCRYPEQDDTATHHDVLYRSHNGKKFVEVSEVSGFRLPGYHNGCTHGDLDGDGFPDLIISTMTGVQLLTNNGDGTFSELVDALPNLEPRWSTSIACGDMNDDGHLDLYVANYVADDPQNPRQCPHPGSPDGFMQCSPTQFAAQDDWLLLSDGQGGYHDATRASGLTGIDGKGLGVLWSDLNADGHPDLYIANDGTPNFLYLWQSVTTDTERGLAIPQFSEQAMLAGCAVNGAGVAEASMGIASGDVDRDGDTDLHLTNFFLESNVLYRNLAGSGFEDATIASRLTAPSRSTMGWGTAFLDADNDGWLDLMVTNGHVDDYSWLGAGEPYGIAPQFFLNQRDGRFADASRQCGDYFQKAALGRGLAVGDLNRDGRPDVIINDTTERSPLLMNETASTLAWVTLQLTGTRANRDAIGARVEIHGLGAILTKTMEGGGSFQSAHESVIHLGLGEATLIPELRVYWPNGDVSNYRDVLPRRVYLARERDEDLWLLPQ